ncbi:hypothetical protein JW887_02150 [Candidatus Dojkabacteria bacterium]|nr:hypothetical protein [Candidatus Dojkabacteria bacterium]
MKTSENTAEIYDSNSYNIHVEQSRDCTVIVELNQQLIREFAREICGVPDDYPVNIAIRPFPRYLFPVPSSDLTNLRSVLSKITLRNISVRLHPQNLLFSPLMQYDMRSNTIYLYSDIYLEKAENLIVSIQQGYGEESLQKEFSVKQGENIATDNSISRSNLFVRSLIDRYGRGVIDKKRYISGMNSFLRWFVSQTDISGSLGHEITHSVEPHDFWTRYKNMLKQTLLLEAMTLLPTYAAIMASKVILDEFSINEPYSRFITAGIGACICGAMFSLGLKLNYSKVDDFERLARETEQCYDKQKEKYFGMVKLKIAR